MKLASQTVRCQARTDREGAAAGGYLMPRRIQSSVLPAGHPRCRAGHSFAIPLADCADRKPEEPEFLAGRMLRHYWAPTFRAPDIRGPVIVACPVSSR